MKLKVCLLAAAVAAKGKRPVKPVKPSPKESKPAAKAWGDDEVNVEACLYTETDGITRVTTEPGLQKLTKCYKHFRCTGGATVQAKMNQMGMGVRQPNHQIDISKTFAKFMNWTCEEKEHLIVRKS